MEKLTFLISLTKEKKHNKIKQYLEKLPTTQKGKIFEEYITELYKGNGWIAVRKGGKNDKGTDILLYHPDTPQDVSLLVQVKNHNNPLSFDDTKIEIIKFEDEASEEYNCYHYSLISVNGFVKEAKKLEGFNMNLEDWSFVEKLINNYDELNNKKPNIELYAHNKLAYENTKKIWKKNNRTAVVQATGTGKSFVIIKFLSDFINEKTLVLAPSNVIFEQIKKNVAWVTKNTTFLTYQKTLFLSNNEINELNPSLIILDEFHRVGAEEWGKTVEKILKTFPNAKILGTSATPIRYLDGERNMTKELFDDSIANELSLPTAIVRKILPMPKYISSLYTLDDEIEIMDKKINDSKNDKKEKKLLMTELKKVKQDWERTNGISDILKKHIHNENKFIIFCKNIEHLEEMEWRVHSWFEKAGFKKIIKKYRVTSDNPESEKELEEFKKNKQKNFFHFLFSVDMLNEGLHISDVDGVILLRSTESPIIFYQQIGRAIQTGKQTQPLIFDFVNNFLSIRSSDFIKDIKETQKRENKRRKKKGLSNKTIDITVIDETKEVIKLFLKIEEKINNLWEEKFKELLNYKEKFGDCLVNQRNKNNLSLSRWVITQRRNFKKGKLSKEKIDKLNNINFSWDPYSYLWEEKFQELQKYKEQYGHCSVSESDKCNSYLCTWITTQRQNYKKGKLSKEKIDKLNNINFSWDQYSYLWEEKFKELLNYKEKFGDCLVNQRDKNNLSLRSWVTTQRQNFQKGKLTQEQIDKLESIGFVWEKQKNTWEYHFKELQKYQKINNHCLITSDYKENPKLSTWTIIQRLNYKKGKLTQEQIDKLESIGFIWNANEYIWEVNFKRLQEYKKQYSHCLVTQGDKNNLSLGNWVTTQRKNYKKGKLTQEQIDKLESVGFVWIIDKDVWEEKFKELLNYREKFGDCLVNRGDKNNFYLGNWVSMQRQNYKKEKLTQEKIDKLNTLGFVWNVKEEYWEKMFDLLVEYKSKYGNCIVPTDYKENQSLGIWVHSQRQRYRKNELKKDKIDKLNSIGFVWEIKKRK